MSRNGNGHRDRRAQHAGEGELADALARIHGPHECPSCGHRWTGSTAPAATPSGLPQRTPDEQELRAVALEPTAANFAAALRSHLGRDVFDMWLADSRLIDATAGRLYLAVPRDKLAWVATRFAGLLSCAATELAGRDVAVEMWAPSSPATRTLGELLATEVAA